MNELHVIDVSALVYVGSTSKYYIDRTNYGVPVGGLHYLMKQISVCFACYDPVVLCFDSPSFRKKIFNDYKSGRMHNQAVYQQIQFAYNSLLACGFRCEKYDGYEADDIVSWAVKQNKDEYRSTIIVGNDHDLCHNVQNGVRFKSIATDSACIYAGNFEEFVDSTYTKFNTISAKKTLCGCKSDKIPAINLENGMKAAKVYNKFIDFLGESGFPYTYDVTSDYRYLIAFANDSGLFSEKDKNELLARIRLVYPAKCPDNVTIKPVARNGFDDNGMYKFLTMINDNDSIKCMGGKRVSLSEDDKQMLRDMARKLSSGEYAADHNLQIESPAVSKTLQLDFFTKEF